MCWVTACWDVKFGSWSKTIWKPLAYATHARNEHFEPFMRITLRVARGIKSFIPVVYVKLLIYHWPLICCDECVVSVMLILWSDGQTALSSVFCQLISICHYQIVLFFVFAVTCIRLLVCMLCFLWGWMFEHVQYATVYSSMIIFAPTNTNWRHSALGVETQSPDPEWSLIYLLKHWGRERRSWIKE